MRRTFRSIFSVVILHSALTILSSSAFAAPPAPLPRTGQTTCYNTAGTAIACAGTGQDGEKLRGVAWPNPRFTDNADGTVTDNLTGLIWLKNANCTDTVGGKTPSSGLPWADAVTWSRALGNGKCGLTDSSAAGQWRLPNRNELESLVNEQQANPAGWLNLQGFSSVRSNVYWSGSTVAYSTVYAWVVHMGGGSVGYDSKTSYYYVWSVR